MLLHNDQVTKIIPSFVHISKQIFKIGKFSLQLHTFYIVIILELYTSSCISLNASKNSSNSEFTLVSSMAKESFIESTIKLEEEDVPKLCRPFFVFCPSVLSFQQIFFKVDRTFRFDVTLLSTFEACEGVVVALYLLWRFREFSVFGSFENFSKLLHNQA